MPLLQHNSFLETTLQGIICFIVDGNRGGAFMLTALAWLTLWKKEKSLPSYFRDSEVAAPYTGTQQNRSDKMAGAD
jgi:hypothetical protein